MPVSKKRRKAKRYISPKPGEHGLNTNESMTDPELDHVWHTRHSCGHSVYWRSEIEFAFVIGAYPCPWCGGETKADIAPESENCIQMKDNWEMYCFRQKNPDGTIPVPFNIQDKRNIIVHHRNDDSCCDHVISGKA